LARRLNSNGPIPGEQHHWETGKYGTQGQRAGSRGFSHDFSSEDIYRQHGAGVAEGQLTVELQVVGCGRNA